MFRKTLLMTAAVLAFVGLAAAPSSAQYGGGGTPTTTVPAPTVPVTTIPGGTAAVTTVPAQPISARPGVSGGTLARTGSSTMPIVAAGLGLLAAGSVLLLVNRRRLAA